MGCAFLAGGVCWVPTGCESKVELVSSSSSDLWRHATLLHGQTKRSRSDACTDRGGCFRGWKRFPSFQRPVDWRDHGERAHLRPQWVCHHLRWQIWNKWQCRKFSCSLRLVVSGRGGVGANWQLGGVEKRIRTEQLLCTLMHSDVDWRVQL